MHIPRDELLHQIDEASAMINVGGVYRHCKSGGLYKVLGLVVIESSDEIAVRYAPVDTLELEFIRPVSSWLELVGDSPRFELILSE